MTEESLKRISELLYSTGLPGRVLAVIPVNAASTYEVYADGEKESCVCETYGVNREEIANFIAAAPEIVAALLAEVQSLRLDMAAEVAAHEQTRRERDAGRTRVAAERDEWQARYEGMEAALRVVLEVMARP